MLPRKMFLTMLPAMFLLPSLGPDTACGQVEGASPRPPAVPLITHNPYFSVWSDSDLLTGSPTRHWTGHAQPLAGLVRVDGKTYRVMGRDPGNVPAMTQTRLQVTMTHTRYTFTGAGIEMELAFFTPAFLEDLDVLSRPVTYLTWTARATDGAQHAVQVYFDAAPEIATSYDHQAVTETRARTATSDVLSVGTREQAVLNRSGDNLRIDWGYFHVAVPRSEGGQTAIASRVADSFAMTGELPQEDALEGAVTNDRFAPHLAAVLPMGQVGAQAVSRHLTVSYTESFAIQYLGRNLRPYWQRNGKPVATMLDEAEREHAALEARGVAFDKELG